MKSIDDSQWNPVVLDCVRVCRDLLEHRNVPQAFGMVGFNVTLFQDATSPTKRLAIAAALEARG
ncbi:hypothetical protein AaE_003779, partial [Aphanomyces astaci]